ncbi:FecCD family ABC transporter permease [Eggerthella sinensis]|jgi:iron complex transport system permease protein|uniref:Iron ABC transporter permease n=1 Tax=Eggerthella sinensis TaxID=242230 RepID=A0A3N0IXH1_9ACTN|nr:iron ABC transporter permease [Eggerthella sinensis]MCB7037602.1 iron ABC transporter permease [Eggerthella sinensis]RDB67643.1 iron ABC transporter permease [Eggerthella sinensis]RNM41674.1 iron ABC transporter permease [Eggerthella sinensis]
MGDATVKRGLGALTVGALIALPLLFAVGSLALGAYAISPLEVCQIILARITGQGAGVDPMAANLVWEVRMPRVLAAAMVGAGLSATGALFQGLFKNPLAAPDTLGVSNGAGFGAALAIVLGLSGFGTQVGAIVFGLVAVGLAFAIVSRGRASTVTLILSGMLIGSLFSSLVSLLKFVADPTEKLPQIVYWLMGSLSGVGYDAILAVLPLYLVFMAVLFLFRWKANVLSLGDAEARSFGIDVGRDRGIIIASCSVVTALTVSMSGIIGWVGIVVPHLARMLVGPDFRRLLPASISLGMCYLIAIDDLCRTVSAFEIPIGVITGIIGVPMFLYFIYRRKVAW